MFYLIYKTTNMINGKYYIGAHKTKDKNDSYLGSGVLLNKSIKKHGRKNFKKEILFELTSEVEMYEKEAELVTESEVQNVNSYNLTNGGFGGFSHIDSSGENNPNFGKSNWKKNKTEEEILIINSKRASKGEKNGMFGKTHTDEVKKKLSEINSVPLHERVGEEKAEEIKKKTSERFKGKPKTEDQKRKMSEAAKARWAKRKLTKD